MKKLLFLPLFAMIAMLVSCSDDDNNNMPEVKSEVYYGNLLFNASPIADDTKCSVDIVGEYASVTLHAVTFAPTMPAMDIVIPALDCRKNGDNYVITGKNVLPTVMGAPVDRYLMTRVEGYIEGDKFVLNTVTAMGTIGFSNALVTPVKPVGDARSFKGELLVGDFSKEVIIDIKKNVTGTLDIVINDAKFAANMPLTLDITLKDIQYTAEDDLTFMAENVAPFINTETEPAPNYMFAVVEGRLSGETLVMSAKMSEELAPYLAGKEFLFEGVEVVE